MSGTEGTPQLALAPLQMSLRALLTGQLAARRRDVVDEYADLSPLERMTAWHTHNTVLEQHAQQQRLEQQRMFEQQRILQGLRAAAAVGVPATPHAAFTVAVNPVIAAATFAAEAPATPLLPHSAPTSPEPASVASAASLPVASHAASESTPRRRSARIAASRSTAVPSTVESSAAASVASHSSRHSARGRNKRKLESSSPPPKKKSRTSLKKPPASEEAVEEDDRKMPAQEEAPTCRICMCEPEKQEESTIDGCDHRFCFDCIGKWAERENTCPLCKQRFHKISRLHPARSRRTSNTKRVKQRDQRSDLVSGANWGELLATIAGSGVIPGRVSTYFVQATRMNNVVMANQAPRRGGPRMNFPIEDNLFDSDDESDDGGITSFMNAIMRSQLQQQINSVRAQAQQPRFPPAGLFGPLGMHALHRTAPASARSHASNDSDHTAGLASNPLEIVDDDDDDDVEVLEVGRSA